MTEDDIKPQATPPERVPPPPSPPTLPEPDYSLLDRQTESADPDQPVLIERSERR
jgi:hypothetical protein